MGYTKDDELAINTIRLLAVSWTPLCLQHEAPRGACSVICLDYFDAYRVQSRMVLIISFLLG